MIKMCIFNKINDVFIVDILLSKIVYVAYRLGQCAPLWQI